MKLISFWLGLKTFISSATGAIKFKVTHTKLYVCVVTQDNIKLLQQFKSEFKHTIKWNKYQSKVTTQAINSCLYDLIHPIFQGVNRLFALSFEKNTDRTVHTGFYLPKVKIKDYNVMIAGTNFSVN